MPSRIVKSWWIPILVATCLIVLLVAWVGPGVARKVHHQVKENRVSALEMQIYEAADRAGLDRRLVRAVVLAESGGDPEARSPRGAVGLMQITPVTLQEVKRQNPALPDSDLTDPVYNLSVGTAYLASLMKRFDNDLTLALAGYHMGPTRVARLKRKHPTLSSQQLVDRFAGPQTKAYLRIVRELILEDTVETEN